LELCHNCARRVTMHKRATRWPFRPLLCSSQQQDLSRPAPRRSPTNRKPTKRRGLDWPSLDHSPPPRHKLPQSKDFCWTRSWLWRLRPHAAIRREFQSKGLGTARLSVAIWRSTACDLRAASPPCETTFQPAAFRWLRWSRKSLFSATNSEHGLGRSSDV
jgi:hypothetical protein